MYRAFRIFLITEPKKEKSSFADGQKTHICPPKKYQIQKNQKKSLKYRIFRVTMAYVFG